MSEFPKHYNHPEVEPRIQDFWTQEKLYEFSLEKVAPGQKIFSVDTPPPYVSADHLHVGHAMSYTQAEFVVRYHRMRGDAVFYPMGFDDNGLPTERFVETKYKINKNKITRKEFVELCLKETQSGAQTYKNLWRALGISVDWNLSFSTIDPRCQKTAQKSFLDLAAKGMLERREDPIIWCYTCQTSLAQADVETEELDSSLNDIEFSATDGSPLVISTTRPELIPACVALYVHPEDERYQHLIGKEAIVPVIDRKVPIKSDESVEKEFGTGLMMVCTWGDMEDVRKWKEHKLETRLIFNPTGVFNDKAGPLAGQYFTKARKAILEMLKEKGLVKKVTPIRHHVGVHERCSTPIDFNIAPQWFIKTLPFRDELLKRGDELNWNPPFMKVRYEQWVRDLKWDWNVSRQRYYGVPFPVWYCTQCREALFAEESQLPVDPTVDKPNSATCKKCGSHDIRAEEDVMDTWMTSSLTPLINAQWANDDGGKLQKLIYPMSVRPQAFEIIRTWLFYTVLKSHFHTQSLPWKDVMISGWGLDAKGRKISKRLGNFVAADEIIAKYSADALRYWAAGSTLGHDLRYNDKDVESGRKIVTKLWNAYKFVSMNLEPASINLDNVKGKNFAQLKADVACEMIDQWVLSKLQAVIKVATENFDRYEYAHALMAIEKFFWSVFCDNYLEIIKDRFWNAEAFDKKSVQSVHNTLYVVALHLLKLFAPFMPYISEEIWQRFFREREGTKSIHIASWPMINDAFVSKQAEEEGDMLLTLLTPIRKYKSLRQLHQNTEIPSITLYAPEKYRSVLQNILKPLAGAGRVKAMTVATNGYPGAENDIIRVESESDLKEIGLLIVAPVVTPSDTPAATT